MCPERGEPYRGTEEGALDGQPCSVLRDCGARGGHAGTYSWPWGMEAGGAHGRAHLWGVCLCVGWLTWGQGHGSLLLQTSVVLKRASVPGQVMGGSQHSQPTGAARALG